MQPLPRASGLYCGAHVEPVAYEKHTEHRGGCNLRLV